ERSLLLKRCGQREEAGCHQRENGCHRSESLLALVEGPSAPGSLPGSARDEPVAARAVDCLATGGARDLEVYGGRLCLHGVAREMDLLADLPERQVRGEVMEQAELGRG